MTPLAKRLAGRAEAAMDRLGCPIGDETILGGDPDDPANYALGQLEHFIHELCHAVLLDVPVAGPSLGSAISAAIDAAPIPDTVPPGGAREWIAQFPDEAAISGVAEEAHAWAVEWHVWQLLQLPFELQDAICCAAVQGVGERQLRVLASQDWAAEAAAVIAILKKECR